MELGLIQSDCKMHVPTQKLKLKSWYMGSYMVSKPRTALFSSGGACHAHGGVGSDEDWVCSGDKSHIVSDKDWVCNGA